jgi:peptidoglycan hydrolase-like protein with peptidoglycan-binding domain
MLRSRRLSKNPRVAAAANNSPPFRKGASGDGVAIVQRALVDLGYPMPVTMARGRADGIYGDETAAAVNQFQRDESLSPDSIAGHDTLHRLDEIYQQIERTEVLAFPLRDPRDWAHSTGRSATA